MECCHRKMFKYFSKFSMGIIVWCITLYKVDCEAWCGVDDHKTTFRTLNTLNFNRGYIISFQTSIIFGSILNFIGALDYFIFTFY